jgi:hypothetical protein
MPSAVAANTEAGRIQFLLNREGQKATRAWIERTLIIYREALSQPASYAAALPYRPRFETAIREFEEWLAAH